MVPARATSIVDIDKIKVNEKFKIKVSHNGETKRTFKYGDCKDEGLPLCNIER